MSLLSSSGVLMLVKRKMIKRLRDIKKPFVYRGHGVSKTFLVM